ncbi:cache domain-containing protein [Thalassovita sp.]|uniref:sensor histidine kinase n=1 Tax=Thalassovita sp. TaxID=1979401 RepID=UPI0029DE85C6|nr:cache domain-containing protein [Thalassovita sp.]
MTSVRLRLLVLALTPLIVLMPLLLFTGMTRWTTDYDKLLIANVESDLRIAKQYLVRLMNETRDELQSLSESVEFASILNRASSGNRAYFARKQEELRLDFLYFIPAAAAAPDAERWPVIAAGLHGTPATQIDIFGPKDLNQIGAALPQRARIPLIDTQAAQPTSRTIEDRGLVVHAASPVLIAGHEGVLVGGILLNRNLDFIDNINALVYLNAVTGGDRQGTATLFLEDVRISTNVRLFEDVRALGTRVSAAVRERVLGQGETWLDRAFVVNDWYISGYLPLTDSFGARVGMLYVGFLEAPFTAAKRDAFLAMLAAFAGVLALSAPVFLWMAKGIFAPLEKMIQTMRRVRMGDMSARNLHRGGKDEISQVAGHLDNLLDQVQERDQRLRSWANELNQRVEKRTAELVVANEKLEQTYRQLVMSEKLASIGEITAGVAHEINNPVAVIQGNVDVIRETLGQQADCVQTELNLVDQQIARIEGIVGKLLTFARPNDYPDQMQAIQLAPIVDDCLVLVEHVLHKGNITVETDFAPAPFVKGQASEFQQVVVNLIVNASQAMRGQGQLFLSVGTRKRFGQAGAFLTVRDTGPGIPDDKLNKLFDPFFTTRIGEGTGLGLSISQSLIQRAGGIITARNHPDGGAELTVWLPEDCA